MAVKTKADEILEKFQKARTRKQATEAKMKELDAFDRNDQWSLEGNNIPPWLPKPVTNFVHLVKYTKQAAFAMENPTGELRPIRMEDVPRIKTLQDAYEFTWEKVNARKYVRSAIGTSKLLGTAILQVYWDEQAEGRMGTTVLGAEGSRYEGEIKVREVDPLTMAA